MFAAWRFLFAGAVLFSFAYSQDEFDEEDEENGLEQDTLTSEQMRAMHAKIDANGDGRMSLHEILEFSKMTRKAIAEIDVQTMIDETDGDKDGKLSLPELLKDVEKLRQEGADKAEVKKRKKTEAAKFKDADTNGDGFLSAEELPALFYPETHDGMLAVTAKESMQTKDVNSDGKLTSKEFWEGDSVNGAISEDEQADFVKLDTDKDGFLSVEELKAWEAWEAWEAMKKIIKLSDKDSDMHVTADEFDEVRESIAGSEAQNLLMEWAEHHEL